MIPQTFFERFVYITKLRCTPTNIGFLVGTLALASTPVLAILLVG